MKYWKIKAKDASGNMLDLFTVTSDEVVQKDLDIGGGKEPKKAVGSLIACARREPNAPTGNDIDTNHWLLACGAFKQHAVGTGLTWIGDMIEVAAFPTTLKNKVGGRGGDAEFLCPIYQEIGGIVQDKPVSN